MPDQPAVAPAASPQASTGVRGKVDPVFVAVLAICGLGLTLVFLAYLP